MIPSWFFSIAMGPCVTKNFFLSHLPHLSHPFLTHQHQWFLNGIKEVGEEVSPSTSQFFRGLSCWGVLLWNIGCAQWFFGFFWFTLWMFRLWTWGGEMKSWIWVASFMEDLLLNSKTLNLHLTTLKEHAFPYTWIREHYELWTIPFPFTAESIQTNL